MTGQVIQGLAAAVATTDKIRWGPTAGIGIVVGIFIVGGWSWPSVSIAGGMVVTIVVVGHCQQW
jgi:hypothetical protein